MANKHIKKMLNIISHEVSANQAIMSYDFLSTRMSTIKRIDINN